MYFNVAFFETVVFIGNLTSQQFEHYLLSRCDFHVSHSASQWLTQVPLL